MDPNGEDDRYCLIEGLEALNGRTHGSAPQPWAPGRREEVADVERIGTRELPAWCMAEVDIFQDLNEAEMEAISKAAPLKTYSAGELVYSPHNPIEALFILKRGRIRIFRVSPDGKALTTALITPGTIFGEMVLLGQQMFDNFAEALEETVVCVMNRADVHRFLLSDPRIAARIAEILGNRLSEMERRLSDSYFKSVPERVAGTLVTLAKQHRRAGIGAPSLTVTLTHEQLATLAGTSRETATKVLGDLAERGLIKLGRGKITVLDLEKVSAEAGDG